MQGIDRKGKFLLMNLESGDYIVIHLRMTGSLYVAPPDFPLEKHTHIVLKLEGDRELRFVDMRRFGLMWLLGKDEEDSFLVSRSWDQSPSQQNLTEAICKMP